MVTIRTRRGRPTKMRLEQFVRLSAVCEARAAIPSDKRLAAELGVSVNTLRTWMRRVKEGARCS